MLGHIQMLAVVLLVFLEPDRERTDRLTIAGEPRTKSPTELKCDGADAGLHLRDSLTPPAIVAAPGRVSKPRDGRTSEGFDDCGGSSPPRHRNNLRQTTRKGNSRDHVPTPAASRSKLSAACAVCSAFTCP